MSECKGIELRRRRCLFSCGLEEILFEEKIDENNPNMLSYKERELIGLGAKIVY